MFYLSDNEVDMNTQDVWNLLNAPTENEQKKLFSEISGGVEGGDTYMPSPNFQSLDEEKNEQANEIRG
jgi:hypothetical protein